MIATIRAPKIRETHIKEMEKALNEKNNATSSV
jgi:hypothetical protein